MADAIMEELWRIKADLSREAGEDLGAYCERLNCEARAAGEVLIKSPGTERVKVAEDSPKYKAGN